MVEKTFFFSLACCCAAASQSTCDIIKRLLFQKFAAKLLLLMLTQPNPTFSRVEYIQKDGFVLVMLAAAVFFHSLSLESSRWVVHSKSFLCAKSKIIIWHCTCINDYVCKKKRSLMIIKQLTQCAEWENTAWEHRSVGLLLLLLQKRIKIAILH